MVTADTQNAIGLVALSAINAIGLVALSAINAVGLIAVSGGNAVGLIAISPFNSVGFIALGGLNATGVIAIGRNANGLFALSFSGRGCARYMLSPYRRDAKAAALFERLRIARLVGS